MTTTACLLCGFKSFKTVFKRIGDTQFKVPGRFSIVECNRCGFLMTIPQPRNLLQYYPKNYTTHIRQLEVQSTFLRRVVRKRIYRIFADQVSRWRFVPKKMMSVQVVKENVESFNIHFYPRNPKDKRCLDVGCGDGNFAQRLKTWGFDVTGCEPDPVAASRASLSGLRVVNKDFMDAEFAPESYNIVVMNHVLEHFRDPKKALRKAQRILKSGGRLVLVVPNASALSRKVFREYWFNWEIPRHLFHFVPETLEGLAVGLGFRTLSIEQRSHCSIWLDSLRYMLHEEPWSEQEASRFRNLNKKAFRRFEQYLNQNFAGDHLAACFVKV